MGALPVKKTLVRLLFANAPSLMLVTLPGIVTLARLLSANAVGNCEAGQVRDCEGKICDVGDAVGNGEAGQVRVFERIISEVGVGNGDVGEAAAFEGIGPDAGNAVGNCDTGQAMAVQERIHRDAGDPQAVGGGWDRHRPAGPGGKTGDGDSIVRIYDVTELGLHRCRCGQKEQNRQGDCQ